MRKFLPRLTFPRLLLPASLLSLNASEAARGFLSIFISRLAAKHSSLLLPVTPNPRPYTAPAGAENAPSPPQNVQMSITANPDLNFGQMALALSLHAKAAKAAKASSGRVPDGLKNAWVALVRQYEREGDAIHEEGISDVSATTGGLNDLRSVNLNPVSPHRPQTIPTISKSYFGMQPSRAQGNFMQDMLSSLMGGGQQPKQGQIAGGAPEPIQPLIIKQVPQPVFQSTAEDEHSADKTEEGAAEALEEEDLD